MICKIKVNEYLWPTNALKYFWMSLFIYEYGKYVIEYSHYIGIQLFVNEFGSIRHCANTIVNLTK